MTFKVIFGDEIKDDLTPDYKTAVKFSEFRIGKRALYFPAFPMGAKYIPLSMIEGAWVRKSTMSIKGCCAGQIPVFVLHLSMKGDESRNFTFDRKKDADRAMEILKEYIPDLDGEPATGSGE